MAARKKTTRQKNTGTKAQQKGRPSRQVMEARTQSIAVLNRAAFAILVVLVCVAVAVTVFPQWGELKKLRAELDATEESEQATLAEVDQKKRELAAIRNSLEFQETRGRDLLDLYVPGETVIRIRRE